MSWDRKGNQTYLYRSVRDDGRVRKLYFGRGEHAEHEARQFEQRRQDRAREREARQIRESEIILATQKLNELRAWADVLFRATLIVAGFHDHRGQIRRRRCQHRP